MTDGKSQSKGGEERKDPPRAEAKQRASERSTRLRRQQRFPVVGIGASAGGLEAFEQFFTNMPPDSGMAFVLVQHLDPTHKSILSDLVNRYTRMTVVSVEDGMKIEPNWVYIIPPDRDMAVLNRRLHLMQPGAPRGQRHPIDFFFRSLSQDEGDTAVCIILSGTGSDGSLGMREIKGEGGMAMVQEPESAKYDGMPRSAIATGLVDYVLPPEHMPKQLIAYAQQAISTKKRTGSPAMAQGSGDMQKILVLLRAQTGHDFSYYKPTTVTRRIERRMAVNQIEQIDDYVRFIREHASEADTLFRELLIGVTNFFRDTDAFQALSEKVIKPLLETKALAEPIRVWVPGCSTGEEAYTIAILFKKLLDESKQDRKIQIFATDIDTNAIETARPGVYPESISADIPPQTLRQYFRRHGSTYEMDRSIRDMLVFAVQSVIKDPPFSKIDLISCRNLLIYMKTELQQRVIPLFHYALGEGGYLFLGTSETIGEHTDLFSDVDRKWKIFKRKDGDRLRYRGIDQHVQAFLTSRESMATKAHDDARPGKRVSLRELTEKKLLREYAPTCIIINEKYEILFTHGKTAPFLEVAPGEANWTILKMVRTCLHVELTNAVRKAVENKKVIRAEGLRISTDAGPRLVDLTVEPITEPASMQGLVAIVLQEKTEPSAENEQAAATDHPVEHKRLTELEKELQSTKEYLQATIEQLETSNEELTSTNEEMQSSNEELQSTNQELQTSKEELQSMNEELATVNTELETKIEALSQANADLNNIMSSTKIAIMFLDTNLCIQRFTPTMTDIVNLINNDLGRPLEHIAHNLEYGALVKDARKVLSNLLEVEKEVQASDGKWYLVRIRPYRTIDNIIDGVVLTFTEITEQKRAQDELRAMLTIADQSPNSVIITDARGKIEYVNPYFTELSGYSPDDSVGKNANILRSETTNPAIFEELWNTIKSGSTWRGELENKRKDGTLYWDRVTITPILDKNGQISRYVGIQTHIDKPAAAK